MIINTSEYDFHWLLRATVLTTLLLTAAPVVETAAQTLDSDRTETIVGSEVKEKTKADVPSVDTVVAAIAQADDAAGKILLLVNVESFDIVFLGEPETIEGFEKVETAIADSESAVAEMRHAMKGSAVFYNALDSHNVDIDKVVAAEITEDGAVTVYLLASK
ncbi:hypothetical protein AAFN47_13815 [Hoeflea sp. CAU 1731]